MAAAVKTAVTVQSSASNAAGATATSATVDVTTALGMTVTARITNGGTGPTVACDFIIEVSNDNFSTVRTYSRQTAGVTASTSYDFIVDLPPAIMYFRTKFTGNTGQAVTVAAELHKLASMS